MGLHARLIRTSATLILAVALLQSAAADRLELQDLVVLSKLNIQDARDYLNTRKSDLDERFFMENLNVAEKLRDGELRGQLLQLLRVAAVIADRADIVAAIQDFGCFVGRPIDRREVPLDGPSPYSRFEGSLDSLWESANEEFEKDNFEVAETIFLKLGRELYRPNSAYFIIGEIEVRKGRNDVALKYFTLARAYDKQLMCYKRDYRMKFWGR